VELFHYAATPLEQVYSVEQLSKGTLMKPQGLWVSPDEDDGWMSWLDEGGSGMDRSRWVLKHRVVLADGAKLLWIVGTEEFDAFEWQYGVKKEYGFCIDWSRVAGDYQGILIIPYLWERRLCSTWYYPWDCASGCIWDRAAIERVERVEEEHESNDQG
jgi:hypothetical protein